MSDSNATITRTQLIDRAFRRVGKSNPTVTDRARAVELFNDIVKRLDSRGRWLTAISNTPYSLTLVTSQASYAVGTTATTIPNYIMELENVEMMSGTTIQYELDVLDKSGSISTPNRSGATSGDPLECYLERAPNPANQKLWVYPTPTTAKVLQIYYRRRLYDFDNATDNPDLPQEHNINLGKILTYELAPEYGVPAQEILALHKPEAQAAEMEMLAANTDKLESTPLQTAYF